MDLHIVLFWLAVLSFIVSAGASARMGERGTAATYAGLVLLSVLTAVALPEPVAITVLFGLFVIYSLAVPVLVRRYNRAMLARDFRTAAQMIRIASVILPLSGLRDAWQATRALDLLDGADPAGGRRLLADLADRKGQRAALYRAALLAADARHEAVADLATPQALRTAPRLLVFAVPALAELGRLHEAIALWQSEAPRRHRLNPEDHARVLLAMYAHAGMTAPLERLLQADLRHLSRATRDFWRVTAEVAAVGAVDAGRTALAAISQGAPPSLKAMIDRRHSEWPAPPALTEAERAALVEPDAAAQRSATYSRPVIRRPVAVIGLALLNVLMFLPVAAGGAETDPRDLYRMYLDMGALPWPEVLETGEIWRLLTAGFVHFNTIHLVLNVVALLLLGPITERAVGTVRFLALFLIASVGAMAGVVGILTLQDGGEARMILGASGGVMGIFGAEIAMGLHGWWRQRAPLARRQVIILSAVVVLQTGFDLAYLEGSHWIHLAGVVLGFALYWALGARIRAGAWADAGAVRRG